MTELLILQVVLMACWGRFGQGSEERAKAQSILCIR